MIPLALLSDLHVDVNHKHDVAGTFLSRFKDFPGYLIIAGDFAEVQGPLFFETFDTLFKINSKIQVIFVSGNHEYYGSSIKEVDFKLASYERKNPQFNYLYTEKHFCWLPDHEGNFIRFLGTTLWYPYVPDVWLLQDKINDFNQIKKFTPEVATNLNSIAKVEVFNTGQKPKTIWVTHHLPSIQSVASYYRGDRLNCYYVDSSFEKSILEHQPFLHVHGHSHHNNCYFLGNTLVLSNPRGYGKENQEFDWFKHIVWV